MRLMRKNFAGSFFPLINKNRNLETVLRRIWSHEKNVELLKSASLLEEDDDLDDVIEQKQKE